MLIHTSRFVLRDFLESDRVAFISYQMDPRYLRLYDFDNTDYQRAQELFDRFITWQQDDPRQNIQVGIFERHAGRLCGSAGLRNRTPMTGDATLGDRGSDRDD